MAFQRPVNGEERRGGGGEEEGGGWMTFFINNPPYFLYFLSNKLFGLPLRLLISVLFTGSSKLHKNHFFYPSVCTCTGIHIKLSQRVCELIWSINVFNALCLNLSVLKI